LVVTSGDGNAPQFRAGWLAPSSEDCTVRTVEDADFVFFEEDATVFIDDFANADECVWEVGDDISRGGERW